MKKFQSVFSLFLVLFFLLVECGVGLAQKVDLKMSEGPLAMYKKPFYLAEKKEKVHYLSYAYNKSTTYTFLFLTFDKETANIQSKKWIDLSIKAFPEKPSNFIKSYDRVEVFTCLDGYLIPKYQETREGASIYSLSKFSFYGQLLYEKPLVDEKGDPIFTSENRSSKLAKTYWDEDKKQFMVMTYESYTPNIFKYFYYDEKAIF